MAGLIFDGNVEVYSTCRDCRTIMRVFDWNDTVHPTCTPKPTRVESLVTGWMSTVMAGDTEAEQLTAAEIDTHDAKPPQLHKAAVYYARMGWPVFPLRGVGTKCDGGDRCREKGLCQCPKKPATRNGFKDATTDLRQIDIWWSANENYNVGLATGSLFDVFDIDTPTGIPSFLKMLEQQRIPQTHGIAVTASGGMHFYLKPTGRTNSDKGWRNEFPGLDYRAVGGYVVAPPSTLGPRERAWSWMFPPSPKIKRGK